MTNFVRDSTSLPNGKTDLTPLGGGDDPTKFLTAAEWNTTLQASIDLRAWVKTGLTAGTFGVATLIVDADGRITGVAAGPSLAAVASSGSGADLAANSVANAKLATMAASTLKGSVAGGTPADLTAAQAKSVLAIAAGDVSGLAAIASSGSAGDLASGAVPAARMPALTGDVTTSAGAVATTIAAHAVTYAKQAQAAANTLSGNNTGGVADRIDMTAAQVRTLLGLATVATSGLASDLSGTLAAAQLPALTGDVTSSAGSAATTIAAHAVTHAKSQQLAANTIVGNNTGGVADEIELTVAQVLVMLGIHIGEFGDGSDGSPTMDGSAAVTGCTRSGSVYTMTRTCFFTNLTINAGVTLKPDGWPLYAKGTLTNNGDINSNGGDASGATNGTAAYSGSRALPGALSVGNTSGTAPQMFDITAAGPGNGGSTPSAVGSPGTGGGVGHGGGGGGGGASLVPGSGTTGNAAGTLSLMAASSGDVRAENMAFTGRNLLNSAFTGATGGGAGGSGSGGAGGGAGAPGGWVAVAAFAWAGSGTWRCRGGNGGVGLSPVSTATTGGGGGGGGGAGGVFALRTGGGTPPTIDVSGGSGGAGGAGGSGVGAGGGGAGGNGGNGGLGAGLVF